ncbi:MAG: Ig-like domain-containing protein [Treponema sp.]|jgi:hypothetical protein|nr:Ig-like domain-containing protein [Treponema sp.]
MKIFKTAITVVFILVIFSNCEIWGSKEIEEGDPGDFEINLLSLSLVREIGTIYNRAVPFEELLFNSSPSFATDTRVHWSSSNHAAATVDQDGNITIEVNNQHTLASTRIRVHSVHDPSVYAECIFTVYPIYSPNRTWTFGTSAVSTEAGVITPSGGTTASAWTNRNTDGFLSEGAIILGSRGFASEYNTGGTGVHEIDPADPYRFGILPTGAPRNWNYVAPGGQLPPSPPNPVGLTHMIRPSGMARFIQINAVQGPFRIEVIYAGNNEDGSNVDIRIGDTEGWRIEGPHSMSNTNFQTVSHDFTEAEFVPVIFLETNSGTRIWRIAITRL